MGFAGLVIGQVWVEIVISRSRDRCIMCGYLFSVEETNSTTCLPCLREFIVINEEAYHGTEHRG